MSGNTDRQTLLNEIAMYKRENGSYDVNRMEKDFGLKSSTLTVFFGQSVVDDDPRIALAVEINGQLYDAKKAAEHAAIQGALERAKRGIGNAADWRLLVKQGLAVAEYNDSESNAMTGAHLRDWRDVDGNAYSDQAGLEENPPLR